MYFVLFEAAPRRDARTDPEAAGAFVSCWIDRPSLDEAVRVARTGIEAEGWIVDELDEVYEVDATTYPPGKEGRESFEQALIDKQVWEFHTFSEVDDESTGE
jgi:hypothetical protein